ncbi:hypothetical protein AQ505_07135 [Pedobacter sp. PACM 27299]|uniref:DUF92 domain-containing protein n=1 Tax=Pedobacter sp. PACM 27299 TaxID=1727164 RepID=UPI00070644FF|nr:DUF92 domain-containing protein [Pedobacter sp. PACM 27299]ALL05285.1 hypothetical protein AQ505_07135 [Pedobacter sp. PACM 27299]
MMTPLLNDPLLQIVLLLLTVLMVVCVKIRKLTLFAAVAATILGFLVALASGLKGILMLTAFFVLSVLATSHKKAEKLKIQPAEGEKTGRDTWQVLANGGVAGITAVLCLLNPENSNYYLLMMAASLASALADTLSSELGTVYGSRFFNILSLKKEAKGLDGVISFEGTLIGALGAGIIALIYAGFGQAAIIVAIAGMIGNFTDSLLGAMLERKNLIGNNGVNFLNTLFAAVTGLLLYLVFH